MQKLLERRLTNTPTDVQSLLVCSSVGLSLNKLEKVSEQALSTSNNSPEGVQPVCTLRDLKSLKVYVLSVTGEPLMPCTPCKAKRLLKRKLATVVKRFPFTIKLNFECENQVQEVKLGIDPGFNVIGFSAITETKELISGTLKLDGKTSERLKERKMYRRNRRNRNTWYRKPRFLNRKRAENWLPPSVQRRYDTHLNLINRLKKILPISEVIIETAKFDIAKIINPDISGIEYQQGPLYNYQNIRFYLMARERGKCQLCGKALKEQPSCIHHCRQKSESGSNRPENLAILHKKCHEKVHKRGLKLTEPKSYKPNTFMSIINKRFWQDIDNLQITYGNITSVNRNNLGLEKSHVNDAFVIAGGNGQERSYEWNIEQKRRHNRAIQLNRKGYRPSIRTSVYKIQPKDLVWIEGQKFSVVGIQGKGRYVKLKGYPKVVPTKDIEKIYNFGSLAWN